MKIDWKHLSTTKGYKSLKAAYTNDIQKKYRSKKELLNLFNWVINRAKHYAHNSDKSLEEVLNKWEDNRTYWWLNYYQECKQPKKHSKALKPKGINAYRKSMCRKSFFYHYKQPDRKHKVCKLIMQIQRDASKKKKPRWTNERKARYKKYRNL